MFQSRMRVWKVIPSGNSEPDEIRDVGSIWYNVGKYTEEIAKKVAIEHGGDYLGSTTDTRIVPGIQRGFLAES